VSADSHNFDRVAGIYRWAEYLALGRILESVRTHWLASLRDCRQALVLGDGDGRFLAALLAQEPQLHATAVDTSAQMLALLTARCRHAAADANQRLTTLHASALTVTPPPGTDLIVTHFFLDCLLQSELDELAARLHDATAPGTLWLVSDFALPQRPWLRLGAALYIRALYLAFRILTGLRVQQLPQINLSLPQHGFERIARHERLGGMLFTELWRRL
jgi:SAM-dependent methyltransferase